jgi:hypothetical protein
MTRTGPAAARRPCGPAVAMASVLGLARDPSAHTVRGRIEAVRFSRIKAMRSSLLAGLARGVRGRVPKPCGAPGVRSAQGVQGGVFGGRGAGMWRAWRRGARARRALRGELPGGVRGARLCHAGGERVVCVRGVLGVGCVACTGRAGRAWGVRVLRCWARRRACVRRACGV